MGVVHRGGHELRHSRRADDSVLHLLSMFGPQRTGDLSGSRATSREGFLLGQTAGRTTLNGEACNIRTPQPAPREYDSDLSALRQAFGF